MQLHAYRGYFEQGTFYAAGRAVSIPERKQITLIFDDEQPQDDTLDEHLAAMDIFIKAMRESDEEVPQSFERIKLREAEI